VKILALILSAVGLIGLIVFHSARLEGERYRQLARRLDMSGRNDLFLRAALEGLRRNPWNVRLHGYAGHALMNEKRYPEALAHLKIMNRYYPYELNGLANAMFANWYLGDRAKAFAIRDRIAAIKPRYVAGR